MDRPPGKFKKKAKKGGPQAPKITLEKIVSY